MTLLLEHPEFHCLTFIEFVYSSLLENSSPKFNFDSTAKTHLRLRLNFLLLHAGMHFRIERQFLLGSRGTIKVFFSSPFVQLWAAAAAAGQKKNNKK